MAESVSLDWTESVRLGHMRIPLPEASIRDGKLIEIELLIKEDPANPPAVGAGNRFLGLFAQEARIVE